MIRGIDVSSAQGAITQAHWKTLYSQGIGFAYIKCGNGNEPADKRFAINAKCARDAGLAVGAYHAGFAIPTTPDHPDRDPVAQARAHFAQSGGLGLGGGELPAALDLEWPEPGSKEWAQYGCTPEQFRAFGLAYLTEMRALMQGRSPVLYDGYPDLWRDVGGASEPAFAEYDLWAVDYPSAWQHSFPTDDSLLVVPAPWRRATLWQANGGGVKLPSGAPVDADVFLGSADDFKTFLQAGIAMS